jgi:hypothetical protein
MNRDYSANERLNDEELEAEFARLFPEGWASDDVIQQIAPAGWEASPLLAVNHPSVERVYEESLQFHRNLASLRGADKDRTRVPEPTFDEVSREYKATPVEAKREVRELVGKCLWDIFSDNHEVIAADGRRLDLGSFRASGGFLADMLNRQAQTSEYDYIDFYLGTMWLAGRADLTPMYRMIFRRLLARDMEWVYHFPRLMLVDFRPLKAALDAQDKPEWENYDPSEVLEKEAENRRRDEEIADLRQSLHESHREAVEAAHDAPPPPTVRAYQEVYGSLPEGWPPTT